MKAKIAAVLGFGVFALQLPTAQAITLDINSNDLGLGTAGSLVFNPNTDTFAFVSGLSGNTFVVEGGTDGVGNISGTFTIGAITTIGLFTSAPVTTSAGATLTITDPLLSVFTADLVFGDIFVNGTAGGLNSGGILNLANISYSGLNSDLIALAAAPTGSASIQFGFNPAKSLTTLTSGTVNFSTTFTGDLVSGSPTVPDGGMTVLLLGAAFLGCGIARRQISNGSR